MVVLLDPLPWSKRSVFVSARKVLKFFLALRAGGSLLKHLATEYWKVFLSRGVSFEEERRLGFHGLYNFNFAYAWKVGFNYKKVKGDTVNKYCWIYSSSWIILTCSSTYLPAPTQLYLSTTRLFSIDQWISAVCYVMIIHNVQGRGNRWVCMIWHTSIICNIEEFVKILFYW